jgi:hypothetical protein
MTSYCPENVKEDKRVWDMVNLDLRCGVCGQVYREYQNVGRWECPKMYVWDFARDREFRVPADHGGPFTSDSISEYPSYVYRWIEGTRPDAIMGQSRTRALGQGVIAIYETVRVSRVNQAEYAKTQHKIHVPQLKPRPVGGYGLLR